MLTNAKLQRMVVDRQIEPERAAAIIMQRRLRQYSANNNRSIGARVFAMIGLFVAACLGLRRTD